MIYLYIYMYINNLKYSSNLRILIESENISDCDMEVYINHLEKLREDFQTCFGDLDNMDVSESLVTPFDMKLDNEGYESAFKDELIEMHVDLKAKALFKSENLSEFCSNINTATKYPVIRAAAKSFLHAFPTLCMAEVGFSNMNTILTKHRKRLNLQNSGDL